MLIVHRNTRHGWEWQIQSDSWFLVAVVPYKLLVRSYGGCWVRSARCWFSSRSARVQLLVGWYACRLSDRREFLWSRRFSSNHWPGAYHYTKLLVSTAGVIVIFKNLKVLTQISSLFIRLVVFWNIQRNSCLINCLVFCNVLSLVNLRKVFSTMGAVFSFRTLAIWTPFYFFAWWVLLQMWYIFRFIVL